MRGPMPHPHQLPTFVCARVFGAAFLSILATTAHAAEPPFSCPAPISAARQKTSPIHQPSIATGGAFDVDFDKLGYNPNTGNGTVSGNVILRQGQRVVKSNDEVEFESADNAWRAKGKVDYEDALIQLTGSSGRYSTSAGASFN